MSKWSAEGHMVIDENQTVIAHCNWQPSGLSNADQAREGVRRAKLIAAAPDMYEALEHANKLLSDTTRDDGYWYFSDLHKKIMGLLKKARSEDDYNACVTAFNKLVPLAPTEIALDAEAIWEHEYD